MLWPRTHLSNELFETHTRFLNIVIKQKESPTIAGIMRGRWAIR